MYDVLIVGGGPAGISAALYARRAGLSVLILDKGNSALQKAERIENYYGLPGPVSGGALFAQGRAQARALGVSLVEEEAVGAQYDGALYLLRAGAQEYAGRALILATGAARTAPSIAGLREYEGRGVSYCAVCDAFFYRGKQVAVLGEGEYALHEAQTLLAVARGVTLATNGKPAPDLLPDGLSVRTEPVAAVAGDDRVREIQFQTGSSLAVDGLFVASGIAGTDAFARVLGAECADGKVVVDAQMRASLPGLYACGDCTGGFLQIAKAVYEGALAGVDAARFVRQQAS